MRQPRLWPWLRRALWVFGAGTAFMALLLVAGCGVGGSHVLPPIPVPPVSASITVSPQNASVNLIGQQQFTAQVTGLANTAVTWSLSTTGCPGATCGTIDVNGLYTAPWCVPTPATVTVIATSVEDPTKSGTAVVTNLVPGPALSGHYTFLFKGTDEDGLLFTAGGFDADANGNITNGLEDVARMSGVSTSVTFSGTYTIACYRRGTLTITDSLSRVQSLAFGLEANGDETRFIELDNTGVRGSGIAIKQPAQVVAQAATQVPSTFAGDFAFGFSGTSAPIASLGRFGMIGRFHADGEALISLGRLDHNRAGTIVTRNFVGSYSVDPVTGRGTATFVASLPTSPESQGAIQGEAFHMAFYVVSPTQSFWISTDTPGTTTDLFAGEALAQSGEPFSNASLNATSIFSVTGKNVANQNADVAVGILSPNGAGTISGGPMDENFDTTLSSYSTISGSYAVDVLGDGRGTLHLDLAADVARDMTFYLVSANTVFLLDGNATLDGMGEGPSVGVGFLEPQTGGPFSLATLTGTYYLGTADIATHFVPVECGVAVIGASGSVSGMGDASDIFGQYANVLVLGGSYNMAANGRGTVATLVIYAVSPAKAILFEMDDTQHQPATIMLEQ